MIQTKFIKSFLFLIPAVGFCGPAISITKLDNAAKPLLKLDCAITRVQSDTANALFQKSHFKQAFKASIPLAKCGDLRAKLEVGFMYEFGKGVKQNYKKAALWYYTAIELNQFNAKPLNRGINAYFGRGEPVSMKKAAQWFRMAAELSADSY